MGSHVLGKDSKFVSDASGISGIKGIVLESSFSSDTNSQNTELNPSLRSYFGLTGVTGVILLSYYYRRDISS